MRAGRGTLAFETTRCGGDGHDLSGLLRRRRYARQHRQVVDMNRGHDGLLYSRYNIVESTTIPTIAPECEHQVPAQLKTGRAVGQIGRPGGHAPPRNRRWRSAQTLELRGRSSSNAFTHIQRPYLTPTATGWGRRWNCTSSPEATAVRPFADRRACLPRTCATTRARQRTPRRRAECQPPARRLALEPAFRHPAAHPGPEIPQAWVRPPARARPRCPCRNARCGAARRSPG